MTPTAEQEFITLWQQGRSHEAMAQALGIPVGTVKSRAHALQQRGLIQARPRGGTSPRQPARPPSTVHRPRSTVDGGPSIPDHLRTDLQAALTVALQPLVARLEALETGLTRQQPEDRPPSTVHPGTVDRRPAHRPPSTVDPDTWELKPLKHSVRWTIYVPQALQEEIKRRAAARGQNPSLVVQEALAQWLAEEA